MSTPNPRRKFLKLAAAGFFSLSLDAATTVGAKPLRGIFPIAQTPFTDSNKLDLACLIEQVRFIDRGGVHGLVWPQLASEWATLSETERLDGAEAIASTGRKLRPAIVIGVQSPIPATAVKFAKHAEKVGADAIIALPPPNESEPHALLAYYKEIGAATGLPLFVQAVGSMSVDFIVKLYQTVPTLRYVKDEAGQPLDRIAELRSRSSNQLNIFTGSHGKTLIDEMIRGFAGSMPAAAFADLYASAWDLWHAGRQKEAAAKFGEAAILINEIGAYGLQSMKYLLCLRGVFKTYRTREHATPLDDTTKQVLRQIADLLQVAGK